MLVNYNFLMLLYKSWRAKFEMLLCKIFGFFPPRFPFRASIAFLLFIFFYLIAFINLTPAYDHMVWSANITLSDNKTIVHGVTKIQQILLKGATCRIGWPLNSFSTQHIT